MITATDINVEKRTVAGRKYVVKAAYELEVGEAIWTQTAPNEYQLWTITTLVDNIQTMAEDTRVYPSGRTGYRNCVCKEGSIVHDINGGVYVDIKKGK